MFSSSHKGDFFSSMHELPVKILLIWQFSLLPEFGPVFKLFLRLYKCSHEITGINYIHIQCIHWHAIMVISTKETYQFNHALS